MQKPTGAGFLIFYPLSRSHAPIDRERTSPAPPKKILVMEEPEAAVSDVDEDENDELEPLFNYTHVRPTHLLAFDNDEFESSPIFTNSKRKKASDATNAAVVVLDDDEEDMEGKKGDSRRPNSVMGLDRKVNRDEDWLPPPPPRVPNLGVGLQENKTLQELRLHKQELQLLAQSAQDALQQVVEAAKQEYNNSENAVEQPSEPKVQRQKIIISIQDKQAQKQFRVYSDDKLERLFKMYAEKVHVKLENLVFSFDGDKVSSNSTPEALGLEDNDIIEVHVKSH